MNLQKRFSVSMSLLVALNSSFAWAVSQPPSKSPLFNQDSVVHLEIAGDFVKIRKAADGGFWGRDENTDDPMYYTTMYLRDPSHPERAFTGMVRARGMSSLTEAESEFPKLKLQIQDSEDLKGTLFYGSRKFRINTHLSTNPTAERTGMGRLLGDSGPYREGLAYKVAETLGLQTPATRLARIQYTDYGTKTKFTRSGLLIETDKNIAERLGAIQIDDFEMAEMETSGIDPVEGALYHLFHALIGNDDYSLRVNEAPTMSTESHRSIFNAMVYELPNKKRIPVVYDLDMTTFVSGYDLTSKDARVTKEFGLNTPESGLFAYRFLKLRQRFTKVQIENMIAIVKSKKAALYQTVQNTPVDKEGRQNALKHLDALYANMDSLLKVPMITQSGVPLFADAKQTKAVLPVSNFTEEPGVLRAGTPVAVLGQEGNMLKVAILNINYDLPNPKQYIGYIPANTKMGTTLPDDLVGLVDEREMNFGGGQ